VLALLDTLTFPETLTILVLALVVLGPEKLPDMARSAGKWMSKIRSVAASLQSEVADVMDDPAMKPLRELGEFAASPRAKLADMARAAVAEPTITPQEAAAAVVAAAEQEDEAAAVVATAEDHPMLKLSPAPGSDAESEAVGDPGPVVTDGDDAANPTPAT
jgi:Tat protein translocase TatB subunit